MARRISLTKISLERVITDSYKLYFKKGGAKVDLYTGITMDVLGMLLEGAGYTVTEGYSNKSFSKYLSINTRKYGEIRFKISDHDSYPELWDRLIEIKSNTSIADIVDQLVYITQDLFIFSSKKLLQVWEAIDEEFNGRSEKLGVVEFYFDKNEIEENAKNFAEFVKKYFNENYQIEVDEEEEIVFFDAGNISSFLQEKGFEFEKVVWEDLIDTRIDRDYVLAPNGDYYNCRFKIDFENKKFWIEIIEY